MVFTQKEVLSDMAFTQETLGAYSAGKMYDRELSFVRIFGHKGQMNIIMQDEEGNELLWTTTAYTKTYQHFKSKARYRFKVDHILTKDANLSLPRINISHMTFAD